MIIVNATLKPKNDEKDEIIKKANDLIAESRTHYGNIAYNLYENVEDKTLTFIEKWESKEALESHMQTDAFIDFGKSTKDMLEENLKVEIYFAELLSDKPDTDVKEIRILYK
ncbi:putative quinol monooxygenase [Methanosphaera cuniculi]|uniref:Putative monooxygenase YcnE n=1 Tax=Methanosphaera cuniculi TaxID=1077256 RepID=A0A2A2HC11_9EURY|nr:putative quinol monooxygenase [Methanosphaera cuniculi]PAV06907.1 hypothetical protein ASJ82_07260 [Methanosphaera cuniculi]PWL08671.1 putative monooxygenase YcnE [Methanosphaera cuniculi]